MQAECAERIGPRESGQINRATLEGRKYVIEAGRKPKGMEITRVRYRGDAVKRLGGSRVPALHGIYVTARGAMGALCEIKGGLAHAAGRKSIG